MADAVAVSVANAVVSYLEAAGTTTAIEPERSYADWELALEDAETLHVDVAVVTSELKVDLIAQKMMRFTVPVDVAIRKRFGTDKQDDDTGRIDLAAKALGVRSLDRAAGIVGWDWRNDTDGDST